ncbi:MAG: tRNA-uridine aminocarboxypropyltransferase [Candidatus Xenobia bacterium]
MGRASITARCVRCRMHLEKCLCAEVPRLELQTRVVLLMHVREAFKITNTARLLTLALPNSEIRKRGQELCPESPLVVDHPLVLFPSEEAAVLTPAMVAAMPRPVRLIVPDGTWRQARKIGRREPELKGLPRYRLALERPSRYVKRREHALDFLCTFEAVTRTLGLLEGPAVEKALDVYFSLIMSRM